MVTPVITLMLIYAFGVWCLVFDLSMDILKFQKNVIIFLMLLI